METVATVLRRAKGLIRTEKTWTTGQLFEVRNGYLCLDALSAIECAASFDADLRLEARIWFRQFVARRHSMSVYTLNDQRGLQEVHRALSAAIREWEQEYEQLQRFDRKDAGTRVVQRALSGAIREWEEYEQLQRFDRKDAGTRVG